MSTVLWFTAVSEPWGRRGWWCLRVIFYEVKPQAKSYFYNDILFCADRGIKFISSTMTMVIGWLWVGQGDPCTLVFPTCMRERRSQRLLMCRKSLQGFVWICCVQQMLVNFSSSKVIHSMYPWLLHIISMQQGNGCTNYCGLQTWHPPSLKPPLPGWWDSV